MSSQKPKTVVATSHAHAEPGASVPNEVASARVPLSQAPGRKKLIVAIPGAAVAAVLWSTGVAVHVTRFVALALCVYAAVGLLEIIFGESLASAARKWDQLAGWKKFVISLTTILGSLALFASLMPLAAQWL